MQLSLLLTFALFAIFFSANALNYKNIQGPASEFAMHSLPQPGSVAEQSNYAKYNVRLAESNGEWTHNFAVDAVTLDHGHLRLMFLTKMKDFEVYLKKAGESEFTQLNNPVHSKIGMSDATSIPAVVFEWKTPVAQGQYTVKVKADESNLPKHMHKGKLAPEMVMIVENDSPYRVHAHFTSFKFVEGEKVGITTNVFDERIFRTQLMKFKGLANDASVDSLYEQSHIPLPRPEALLLGKGAEHIEWDVTFPDGHQEHVDLLSLAQARNDNTGIYTGAVVASQPGDYSADLTISGTLPDGHVFERSIHQIFKVVSADEDMSLLTSAPGTYDAETQMLSFELQASVAQPAKLLGQKFKAYAEVWAADSNSEPKSVGFVAGMTNAAKTSQSQVLKFPLKLHVNWLHRANVLNNEQIVLKNVYIQDVATSVPLTEASSINVAVSTEHRATMMSSNSFNGEITEEMKMGPRPDKYNRAKRSAIMNASNDGTFVGGHKVILSHGYCTNEPGFPIDQFKEATLFEDYNQNRNNDEFAQLLSAKCDNYESCAIIGHSQAGLASLHALAYYWSALDTNAEHGDDERWIQSVGSPYQGTSASSWGDLGSTFGVACGSVYDMTPEGAKLWLAQIPAEARDHVRYYRTDYGSWSSCSLASNLVLKWTNDGATETDRAKLPGGHSPIKVQKKLCHTDGMNYPNQCTSWAKNNCFMKNKAAGVPTHWREECE